MFRHAVIVSLIALTPVAAPAARAETPAGMLAQLERAARAAEPGFGGFSAQRGEQFFHSAHGSDWSCGTCHGRDPATTGRHARTHKSIAPLAPAANAERFTDPAKVEKWFKRNCNDVLHRACTPREKGDVLSYLLDTGKSGGRP